MKMIFIKRLLVVLLCSGLTTAQCQELTTVECVARNGLPNIFLKLKARKPLKIAYLGGSITAAKGGWREQSLTWLKKTYSSDSITGINAGLPGTGSDLGAFRLKQQVLRVDPDLVFVEFAVNDGSKPTELIHQTMEGIVRQIRQHNATTEICFVYTIAQEMLTSVQKSRLPNSVAAMEDVADLYGIPTINFGLAVANEVTQGRMVFKGKKEDFQQQTVFSPDGVHPFADTGHKLYTDVLVRSLGAIFKQSARKSVVYEIPMPFEANNWEKADLLPVSAEMKQGEWQPVDFKTDELRLQLVELMHGVIKAQKPGAALRIHFTGTMIGLMDIIGPGSGQYEVFVDGKLFKEFPRFDKYCTDYRVHYFVLPPLADGKHTVEFRVSAKLLDKAAILKQMDNVIRPEKATDYQEHSGFALGILLNGKLL